MKYNCLNNLGFELLYMEEHCFNLVMTMLGNHTCTEGYDVAILISKAI